MLRPVTATKKQRAKGQMIPVKQNSNKLSPVGVFKAVPDYGRR